MEANETETLEGASLYAQVIVDVSHARLDRIFEYRVPDTLRDDIQIGHRVLLPFGAGNRKTEGFVIGLSPFCAYDPQKLKEIQQLMEPYAVLLPEQVELARWMSEMYHCLLVEALRLMIPAQLRGNRVRTKTKRVVLPLLQGEQWTEACCSLLSKDGNCKAPQQMKALLFLQTQGQTDMEALLAKTDSKAASIQAMAKKGWVAIQEAETLRRPYASMKEEQEQAHALNQEQQAVTKTLRQALDAHEGAFVLKGVTGSGKTEVYLHTMLHCLQQGRTAIMLVPEISLTPQTVERFRNRFGDAVAVLHSRLSAGERYDEWRRIRLGDVRIVVGARSAAFAPLSNLGLVVIDEEHEGSYQSDKTPRYHAADIAQWRCKHHGGVLLLGSATPALETWHRAQQGEFRVLQLTQRINGKPLPAVEVVDMRQELAAGNRSMFSSTLYDAMKECYFSGRQMILFLNRRGYSTFVSCRRCGEVLTCPHCDVSMTYHKGDHSVRCHYCDEKHTVPATCPSCGEAALKHFGVGTEQVEEQVLKLLPGIRVTRMDYDTTRGKEGHLKLLNDFRERRSDVLIGTQMIAKGLDFPEVTLVGVIAADSTLHVPDFRSAERAFQLLTQVAGRAGRDKDAGRVVVQTYSPQHPSIRLSATHDYDRFYDYEIQSRAESEFPPFADFVRFLFAGADDEALNQACQAFGVGLRTYLQAAMETLEAPQDVLLYLSAHASPLHWLRGEYRHQVVLKLRRTAHTSDLLRAIVSYAKAQRDEPYLPIMEVNPQSMN